MSLLFSETTLGPLKLQNRLVMSPMTRSRAIGNVPNDLMVEYYRQRASAGLIITEGTSPSPNGLGYPRIPGIYSPAQTAGWKAVTDAVHTRGAKIFIQFMHTGRVGHPLNLPAGAKVGGPSAVSAAGEMFTDAEGMKPNAAPAAMTEADIKTAIDEFAQAAKNAVAAGFDGVELHGANGYLLEQFIRPNSNRRTDAYGGSIEGRARFVLEVAKAVIAAIGKDKVGIRLSPYGVFNDMPTYPEMEADYTYLAKQLNALGLVYGPPRRSFFDGRTCRASVDQGNLSQGVQTQPHPVGRLRCRARRKRSCGGQMRSDRCGQALPRQPRPGQKVES
jgi:N-ethylmaleimide reductase